MKRQYLITDNPFRGRVRDIVNGIVEGTGEIKQRTYIDENGSNVVQYWYENNLTLEKYVKQKGFDFYKVVEKKELDLLFHQYHESLLTDWQEITENRFDYSFECLPPMRFTRITGGFFFFISEIYTGNIHSCYVKLKNKYYSSMRRINESTGSIVKSIEKIGANGKN